MGESESSSSEQREIIESWLSSIRAVLQNADSHKTHSPAPFVLDQLTELAYVAQNVLDDLNYQIEVTTTTTKTHFNSCFKPFLFLKNLKLYYKFKHVELLFQKIPSFLEISGEIRVPRIDSDRDIAVKLILENPIVGREADASKIVKLLTPSCSDQHQVLIVVPIVGMDGLGKTALASFVSQQVMALDLFDVKMWVCLSDKCDELKVLCQMLRSLSATMAGLISLTDKDALFQQLEKELSGKSFILVLDDVCEDGSSWWGDFRTRLLQICTNNGNVVLVTTRSEEVASVVETSSQHRHTLDFLSDDECWFILKSSAFRNVRVQSSLEIIGRLIAEKCRGVPLAAKVLGGTLGFMRDGEAWVRIIDSHVSNAWDESVKSILKLSFEHFETTFYASKPCFALCSVFPKGVLIAKEDLILQWMAGGFVHSYDMGNEYFQALLENAFFQDTESDDDVNVIKCKMHSLVHDLALSLVKSEMRIHYLYVDYQSVRSSKSPPKNGFNYLHTIILNGAHFQSSWNSKRLETLYLNDVDMESLPSSINKLKHFKYLHISNTKTRPLPKSITEIYMLQILTLSNCSCEQLPFLGHLPFLKFLKISHMKRVKCIGNESHEGSSSRHESAAFPALKSLSLSWMENLVEWCPPSHGNEVFIFPLLENLSIQCCSKLTGFPIRDLTTLVKIEIKDCEELGFIFKQHKSFPSVTSLSIVGCSKLTYLRNWLLANESYKEFRVRRCGWLKFIPDDLGMQRSLVSLHIYCCKGLGLFSEEILCKLTKLRKLSIGAFSKKLDDFRYLNRIKDLERLTELEIWGSDIFGRKMSALPNQLQHLYGLKSLKIKGFTTMEALPEWLVNLQSLQTISLNYCWHLEHQPTAAIIQQLSNLSHIYIYGCHVLEEHKSQ